MLIIGIELRSQEVHRVKTVSGFKGLGWPIVDQLFAHNRPLVDSELASLEIGLIHAKLNGVKMNKIDSD